MSDYPPEMCRDFLREVIDRNRNYVVAIYLTTEEARLLWAAERHLDAFETNRVGVEQTDFSIGRCRQYLTGCVDIIKVLQARGEEIVLELSARCLKILEDVERHLDRYSMMIRHSQGRKKW